MAKLKKFEVNVREVHIQPYSVEANSKEEALQIVRDCGGEIIEGAMSYSHVLHSSTWTVDEVK